MKAQITLTDDDIAKLLRAHLEQRGLLYDSHVITSDGRLVVEADLGDVPLRPAPVAAPAPAPARAPEARIVDMTTLAEGDLRLPSEDPDPDSSDTTAPQRRSHPKQIDDELARILAENAKLEAQKGKRA